MSVRTIPSFFLLVVSLIVTVGINQKAWSQVPTSPPASEPDSDLAPYATFIGFDDVPNNNPYGNSVEIYRGRYPGVSFYDPYAFTTTFVTRSNSYTYPNSLIVGYVCNSSSGEICSDHVMYIDFTQKSKDVSFLWGRDFSYGSGTIYVYQGDNYELVAAVPVGLAAQWTSISLSAYSQTIKRVILTHPGTPPNVTGHIFIDNFQFTPVTTQSPAGTLESVSTTDAAAVGWSADPDSPAANNFVDCHIDGQFSGRVTANLAGAGAPNPPYTGNHRFSYTIPNQYRDGNNHQISCYGIDYVGGNPNTLLTGSPKTFNIPPKVISTTFIALAGSPVTQNNNPGGGLRMFPERATPTGPVNNIVNVKAKISPSVAGKPVYFYAYDLDDPSASAWPLDDENSIRDNRSDAQIGDLCPDVTCFDTSSSAFKVLTNASGEAIIPFRLTGAHPGDNYAVIATTNPNVTSQSQIVVEGIALRNSATGQLLAENIDRTPMLTAWRTLHVERDSMGIIVNAGQANFASEATVGPNESVEVPVLDRLDTGRFENGRLTLEFGNFLNVIGNSRNAVTLLSSGGSHSVLSYFPYTIYDDDDFNSDNASNGFDGDQGEDIEALADTYNLLKENDDRNCDDGECNVFAAAYIRPSFAWANQHSTSDVLFVQNISEIDTEIDAQVDRGRYLNSGENNEFWVAYVQIAYQPSASRDCDPNAERGCIGGITVGTIFDINDVTNAAGVPSGANGSLIYIETMRDVHGPFNELRIRTVPHEIGHQFGISGDLSEPTNFQLMGFSGGRNFIDRHLNVIRWRRSSPYRQ